MNNNVQEQINHVQDHNSYVQDHNSYVHDRIVVSASKDSTVKLYNLSTCTIIIMYRIIIVMYRIVWLYLQARIVL